MSSRAGCGVFGLKPGQWTDDTSMALCLAESLVRKMNLIGRPNAEIHSGILPP
ncbi:ADP-ribosylglycohydrolase family protein [Paenibacillus sp. NRS-1782]|uniref:ADP-ribosylglycohydrolase family protein n=1 Tax=unclassified Paenibacillus TaxID=185978 RepID=UPI003D28CF0B